MMDNNQIKNLQIAEFQGTELEIIDRNGVPWLKSSQIGKALGYANRADNVATQIYNRNKDEFTSEMTALISLPYDNRGRQIEGGQGVDGNALPNQHMVQTRVFSPRGCWLLGMFARTKKAKEFRKWVLDVLEGHIQDRRKPQKHQLTALQQALLDRAPTWREILRYLDMGLNNLEIARLLIYSSPINVLNSLCQMENCGILPPGTVVRLGYAGEKDIVIAGQEGCYAQNS